MFGDASARLSTTPPQPTTHPNACHSYITILSTTGAYVAGIHVNGSETPSAQYTVWKLHGAETHGADAWLNVAI